MILNMWKAHLFANGLRHILKQLASIKRFLFVLVLIRLFSVKLVVA